MGWKDVCGMTQREASDMGLELDLSTSITLSQHSTSYSHQSTLQSIVEGDITLLMFSVAS